MVKSTLLTLLLLFILTAGDNEMLQDVCVADLTSRIKVNGYTCKPEAEISAEDFSFNGIAKDGGLQNNTKGWSAILVTVEKLPGLNTLGMSMFKVDLAPGTAILHSHPRGTEMIFMLQGQVDIGFFTTSGTTAIVPALFAANPPLPDDVLTANFRLTTDEVQKIKQTIERDLMQSKCTTKNNNFCSLSIHYSFLRVPEDAV